MLNLNNDIKNNSFKQVYLLTGTEEFLIKNYKNKLKASIVGEDEFNYSYFEGKNIDVDEVINIADTLPFFSDKRCIMIEDSTWFKSSNDKLYSYLDKLPSTSFIIFIENGTDKIDKRNRLYKRIKEIGYIAELNTPEYNDLKKWAAGIIIRDGKKITSANMDILLEYIGDDMERIKNELDKLLSYIGEREIIELSDIDSIITINLNNRIFDMVRAITMNRTKEAMKLYQDLLLLKESPRRILFYITKQFTQLLNIKDMLLEGEDRASIAKKLKLQQFVVSKLVTQVRDFDRMVLYNYMRSCIDLDEDIKKGNIAERMAVELLISGN